MRVCYLTEEAISFSEPLVRGGAIHVRNVVEGLWDRGIETSLVDWNDTPEREFQFSIQPRSRFVAGALLTTRQAVDVARRSDADVIVSKTRKTYLPGWVAAQRLDVPHVVHVGSSLDPPTAGPLDRLSSASFRARLGVSHDGYLVVCDHIGDQLRDRGVEDDRIFDVKNAVDTERFHPGTVPEPLADEVQRRVDAVAGDAFTLGFVGGIHDYKGVHDLAAAIEQVDTPVHLLVAGDGPAREAFAGALGSRGTFLGSVPYDQIPALYHELDAFVLPSHTEGLPRVVLEAQATGTPVVATAVGGVPEVVTDEETGLLCSPHSPTQLAAAIDRLAGDEDLREELSTSGRETVADRYTWPQLYDRYEQALAEIVARHA